MPKANQRAMRKVLFIQGGGADAHEWDARLARSLEGHLGAGFEVLFPRMPDEADPNYPAWMRHIRKELRAAGAGTVLVAHSIGASMVMKMLAEEDLGVAIPGVFLIAAPFLNDHEGWAWKEAELPANAADKLPRGTPLYLYHGDADEEVPVAHLELYAKAIPSAVRRVLAGRNHQINDDLSEVAADIRRLVDAAS